MARRIVRAMEANGHRAGLFFSIMVAMVPAPSAHQAYESEMVITKELGDHLRACPSCRRSFARKIRELAVYVSNGKYDHV